MPQFEIANNSTNKTTTSANYVTLPTLTQTEINALTGVVAGSKLYNSTTGKEQVFTSSAWENIPTFILPYTIKTADYTTTILDSYIEVTVAGVVITLVGAGGNTGRKFTIINSSAGSIIVTLVEGSSSTLFAGEVLDVISNGTIYKII